VPLMPIKLCDCFYELVWFFSISAHLNTVHMMPICYIVSCFCELEYKSHCCEVRTATLIELHLFVFRTF